MRRAPADLSTSTAAVNVSSGISQIPAGCPGPPNQRIARAVTPCRARIRALSRSTRPLEPARTTTAASPPPTGVTRRPSQGEDTSRSWTSTRTPSNTVPTGRPPGAYGVTAAGEHREPVATAPVRRARAHRSAPGRPWLRLDQADSDGVPGEFQPVLHAELLQEVGPVPFHGLDADDEDVGDLL